MTTAPCEAFSKHHFHPNTQTSSGEDQNHCAINFLKIEILYKRGHFFLQVRKYLCGVSSTKSIPSPLIQRKRMAKQGRVHNVEMAASVANQNRLESESSMIQY